MWSWLRIVGSYPQPLKGLFVLAPVGFVATLVGFFSQASWTTIPWGVCFALIGLTLLFNLRGSAHAVAETYRTQKFAGIDYSGSFLATPAYARFVGAMATVVGLVFVFVAH